MKRDAHQPRQRALQRRAAAAGVEVGDEDERQAFQRARAEALQRAERDQLLHVLRGRGERGAGRKSTMPISSSARRPWRSDSRA